MSIWVLIILGIGAFLVYVASRPNTFRVQRETVINAAPERVFNLIDDLRQWAGWSPWEKIDPGMQRRFDGPEAGVGAHYAWEGNKQVGAGEMTITRSEAPNRVDLALHFIKPFEAHNVTEFVLAAEGNGTRVVWSIHGPCPFMSKLLGIFVSMDKMIGKDFEKGLNSLKLLAEQ